MAGVTYYVVVPFTRDEDGLLTPGAAKEAPNGELAKRRAQALSGAASHVGAVAFSRTGDPDSGEFSDDVVLATYGEVDIDMLAG